MCSKFMVISLKICGTVVQLMNTWKTVYPSQYCDNTMEKALVERREILGSNLIFDK
jgi:hypothetical protein